MLIKSKQYVIFILDCIIKNSFLYINENFLNLDLIIILLRVFKFQKPTQMIKQFHQVPQPNINIPYHNPRPNIDAPNLNLPEFRYQQFQRQRNRGFNYDIPHQGIFLQQWQDPLQFFKKLLLFNDLIPRQLKIIPDQMIDILKFDLWKPNIQDINPNLLKAQLNGFLNLLKIKIPKQYIWLYIFQINSQVFKIKRDNIFKANQINEFFIYYQNYRFKQFQYKFRAKNRQDLKNNKYYKKKFGFFTYYRVWISILLILILSSLINIKYTPITDKYNFLNAFNYGNKEFKYFNYPFQNPYYSNLQMIKKMI